jgi:hypothetical protein
MSDQFEKPFAASRKVSGFRSSGFKATLLSMAATSALILGAEIEAGIPEFDIRTARPAIVWISNESVSNSDAYYLTHVPAVRMVKSGTDKSGHSQSAKSGDSGSSDADPALPVSIAIGDTVINPLTGASETVIQVLAAHSVLTDANNTIFLVTTVGATFVEGAITYTVTAVTTDATSGLVDSVTYADVPGGTPAVTIPVVDDISGAITGASSGLGGGGGDTGATLNPTIPAGNTNVYTDRQRGANGGDGDNAWGLRICIFGACVTIGENGTPGDPGGPGPDISADITVANNGNIESITDDLPGISITSIGGDGGEGGDAIGLGFTADQGGAGGTGGNVELTSSVDISTSGVNSHGIFIQSRAGSGGDAGNGYILSAGGTGGPAVDAGTVSVVNDGSISTTGVGALGILAQSLGGASGGGGDSFGIVGAAGTASEGGNGSSVSVVNNGTIVTTGLGGTGIMAQSVGGSGGNGGASGGIAALGGGGGGGGDAGTATVTNSDTGVISTSGADAAGILVQSIGGGGGAASGTGGLVAVGGDSGGGGDSDIATGNNAGSIFTEGDRSAGLLIQSIGGGGGSGAGSGGLVAVGGTAGDGGAGDDAIGSNTGSISTEGENSAGILIQSIGGGGGNAAGTGGLVAVGGDGAGGGNSGNVTLTGSGSVVTTGANSAGIIAQAIGGGGGNAAGTGGAVSIGGGTGGGGGGGTVDVTTGSISTSGDGSIAVIAQSIGGGGGNAAGTGGLISIGGSGSTGGTGNTVVVTTNGIILTTGLNSTGILAQSIGGGGGNGGSAGGSVAIGGSGAGGGNANTVTVNANQNIITLGDYSNAIIAQSVGGGGGNGGNATSGGLFGNVSVGGSGAGGGRGFRVEVNTVGDISTTGDGSTGILMQSVGGGGGNGGYAVGGSVGVFGAVSVGVGGTAGGGGNGGEVAATIDGQVHTWGNDAHGVLAQSIGGGGGNGGQAFSAALSAGVGGSASISVSVGGSGGVAGIGDIVTVSTGDTIVTEGDNAFGVLAQSVGGGGGNGGWSGAASLAVSDGVAGSASISMGGAGGAGGAGGDVTLNGGGDVMTLGDGSHALVAQSLGGGGGNGGFSFAGSITAAGGAAASVNVALGGDGGSGSHAGDVIMTSTGAIQTGGDNANGLMAQSVGGGGGNGGWSATGSLTLGGSVGASVGVSLGGDGGTGATGGAVSLDATGTVLSQGNSSTAILAQSIGGGGGNGGFSFAGSLAGGGSAAAGVNVALGGDGGSGGVGGTVDVTTTETVQTLGDNSNGIVAQSIGGGGGNGGWSATGTLAVAGSAAGAVGVSLGGDGGSGNNADNVTVDAQGQVLTEGDGSIALLAQSVGGGGGNGGFAFSGGISGGNNSAAINVGLGGSGETGGLGADVDVTTGETVYTLGTNAHGIVAQSIGGGGGNGGWAGTGALTLGGGSTGSLGVSLGGDGGDGADSGDVTVNADGQVGTEGDGAIAVLAQSVGGGGGNGGFAFSGSIGVGGSNAVGVNVALGGTGSTGGDAGVVTLNSGDIVATLGTGSHGLMAQSIGGGGGNGGWAATGTVAVGAGSTGLGIGVSLGGDGGTGGDGNSVVLTNVGDVSTQGGSAHAIIAQSVGGGGGNGGFAFSGGLTYGSNSIGANVALGGSGGDGGDAGTVDVDNDSMLFTLGTNSFGLLAQSIGGGGGNGGWSGSLTLAGTSSRALAASVSIGGSGGTGGDADAVTVNNSGIIATQGGGSMGIFAQSIGGGGGTGGFSLSGSITAGTNTAAIGVSVGGDGGSGGDASTVDVTNSAQVTTEGDLAHAIVAQSVGGGGGRGGWTGSLSGAIGTSSYSASVGIGGSGGTGGDAGAVTITNSALIATVGNDSSGLLGQSIGGGGGAGGFSLAASASSGTSTAVAANVTVGGSGGSAGNADDVDINSTAAIWTQGDRSHGIHAQTLGGGGGAGGWTGNLAGTFSRSSGNTINVGIGGSGGGGGDAGNATVTQTAMVATQGDASHGVFAQSVGGGGGDGGFSVSGALTAGSASRSLNVSVGGSGGTAGAAGTVDITTSETITTTGAVSHGIYGQSVGGGGGSGGFAGSFTGNLTSQQSTSIGISIGGDGAGGGDGNTVTVNSTSDIGTTGAGSHGLFAQSVGGGGGNGGSTFTGSFSGSSSNNFNLSMGGTGGIAGIGGDVTVNQNGLITTSGAASYGVFAQSVGGGGGQGGYAGGLSMTGSNSNAVSLSIGGAAGDGSIGGTVNVDVSGYVQTTGEAAHAIVAQSIGGGGGQGGMVGVDEDTFGAFLTGSTSTSYGTNTRNLSVSLGGAGGLGNHGGNVTVISDATLVTTGNQSAGIYAESVGGGGGDAGVGLATSGAVGAGRNSSYAIGIGGAGGAGGDGGIVDVSNLGSIMTFGGASHGILAQSIGGGGGNGGDAGGLVSSYQTNDTSDLSNTQVSVSLGGSGGAAGDGGTVIVDNSGSIMTVSENAFGVFAQSVGGGGGTGGLVSQSGELVSEIVDKVDKGDANGASVNIGGVGGAAGDGGDVTVNNSGEVVTLGARGSYGIFAQSVGGGGGVGGSGLAGDVAVGGAGGAAGDGGNIAIDNSGSISTTGALAHGIFAQSIGGGGGVGGATDYSDDPNDRTALEEALQDAADVNEFISLVESFNEPSFTLNIGGQGGAAGDGGDITIINSGSITTQGQGAHGIMVQTVGGGGGDGGAGSVGAVGDITVSGFGGSAGDGGSISVLHTGNITTSGYGAYGIFAQSVGGGGGVAGDYSFGFGDQTQNVGLNPFTGGSGDGGDITIISQGDIVIRGSGAMGIFAQSVGGGGGLVGLTGAALSQLGSFGGAGTAGTVTIEHSGNVIAPDLNAIAVILQSDGTDGDDDLAISLDSDIRGGSVFGVGVFFEGGASNLLETSGTLSAVSGQAINMTTGDDVVLNSGLVVGNVDLGSGANSFSNGVGSTFVAMSTIDLRDPVPVPQTPVNSKDSDTVVMDGLAESEFETVTSSSEMSAMNGPADKQPDTLVMPTLDHPDEGSVSADNQEEIVKTSVMRDQVMAQLDEAVGTSELPQIMPALNESKLFDAAGGFTLSAVPVAPEATFLNSGNFLMGLNATIMPIDLADPDVDYANLDAMGDPAFNLYYGTRVINEVALDGHYIQTDTGYLNFDIAFGPYDSDHVTTTGDVTLDGAGDVTLVWLSDAVPVAMFSGDGVATDNGLEITDTLAVDFSIITQGGDALLAIETDFGGVDGLNRNEREMGAHMDHSLMVGGAEGTGRLLAWLGNLQDADAYNYLMTELNPEPHIAPLQGLISTSHSFGDDLMSCGTVVSAINEGECFWSKVESSNADRDSSFERFGTQADSVSVRGGYQHAIDEDWHLGVAIGIESIDYRSIDQARAHTNGDGVTVGVALKRSIGDAGLVAGSISGGWLNYETQRQVNTFEPGLAESTPSAGYAEARLRASWLFESDHFYMMPRADMTALMLRHDGFAETGIGGIGVASQGDTQSMFTVSPAIEFGWSFDDGMGSRTRASLALGARLYSEDNVGLPISFVQAPVGTRPAFILTEIDQELYTAELGFEVIDAERINVELGYRAEFGRTTENHQVGLKLGFRF